MSILLIAATRKEIQPTIDYFEKYNKQSGEREVETLLTGIGLVSTTYFLTRKLNDCSPDLAIQAGVAGCFTGHKLGQVILVKEDLVADMGVMEEGQFKNIFDLRLEDENFPPFQKGSLINPFENLLSWQGIEQAKAISVNEITTDPKRIECYRQRYVPVAESMEGAAFHYVCLIEKIPFLQVRALSNYIGERDKAKWKIKEAIENLNETLISLINSI